MSKVKPNCIGCGAALPADADQNKQIVICSYCGIPNENPSFDHLSQVKFEKKTKRINENVVNENEEVDTQEGHIIKLEVSSFASLYAIGTIMIGVGLFVYYWFHPQNMWVYLLTSLFVIIPAIKESFVPARWANVAKNATTISGEKFFIKYNEGGGIEVFGYFISFFYQIWFFYNLFASFVPVVDEIGGKEIICGTLAFIFSCAGIFFVTKLSDTIGEFLGNLFSKKI